MNDLKLIATLPSLCYKDKVSKILHSPDILEVRYNTGINDLLSVEEMLCTLKQLEITYNKKIWIDLKGRQLRIIKWADPLYDVIELNHEIDIEYPAKVIFRNGSSSEIIRTRKNKIMIDPLPKEALGSGQSINIIAKSIEIKDYLTDKDKEILKCCQKLKLNNIMASFVERIEDITEITDDLPNANIICKIESLKGLKFALEHYGLAFMAARDDLYTELGQNNEIIQALQGIINQDKNAICASKIFSSLIFRETPDLADYSDLNLMMMLGYKNFMLDDTISLHHFEKATNAWKKVLKR